MDGSFISREGTQREASLEGWDVRVRRKLRIQCWKAGIEVLDECPTGEIQQEVGYCGLGFRRDLT